MLVKVAPFNQLSADTHGHSDLRHERRSRQPPRRPGHTARSRQLSRNQPRHLPTGRRHAPRPPAPVRQASKGRRLIRSHRARIGSHSTASCPTQGRSPRPSSSRQTTTTTYRRRPQRRLNWPGRIGPRGRHVGKGGTRVFMSDSVKGVVERVLADQGSVWSMSRCRFDDGSMDKPPPSESTTTTPDVPSCSTGCWRSPAYRPFRRTVPVLGWIRPDPPSMSPDQGVPIHSTASSRGGSARSLDSDPDLARADRDR